ncbi:MAG TPA: AEC family transporter [Candidatus Desulfobacillus sp.]|nr:AEC family transporter [Candidatus Desulfobacillus sp.]
MSSGLLLLPDFALILLGAALRRGMPLGEGFWSGLEKLIYFVLFPALLFHAIARSRIDFAAVAPFVASGVAATVGGMLLGLLARPLFGARRLAFASRFQCAFRFNSYIGLAVAASLHGEAGIVAMGILVGVMVPIVNLVSVWMLARHGELGALREIARNPLILATLAGLLFNLAGGALPAVAGQFLGRLAEASIALGLLAVGAALQLRGAAGSGLSSAWLLSVKLLALPALAWAMARLLGLEGAYFDVVVMFCALPVASSAYILAMRMGGDGEGVAWLISVSTLAAMLTMPLWLVALGGR